MERASAGAGPRCSHHPVLFHACVAIFRWVLCGIGYSPFGDGRTPGGWIRDSGCALQSHGHLWPNFRRAMPDVLEFTISGQTSCAPGHLKTVKLLNPPSRWYWSVTLTTTWTGTLEGMAIPMSLALAGYCTWGVQTLDTLQRLPCCWTSCGTG